MKKLFAIVLGAILVVGVVVWIVSDNDTGNGNNNDGNSDNNTPGLDLGSLNEYTNEALGISFLYPKTYTKTEGRVGTGAQSRYQITLVPPGETPAPQNGEGPIAITIELFNRPSKKQLNEWLQAGNANFNLRVGDRAATTISGREAVAFHWSGLYEGDTIAIAAPIHFVVTSATYRDPSDQTRKDFPTIVGTLAFVDPSADTGDATHE